MTTNELWEKYKAADVSANELKFFRYIEDNVDKRGIFNKKNVDIAKEFNVGDRTISRWVDALEKAELITSFQNRRQHVRNIRIYYAKKKAKLPDYAEMSPAQKLFQDAFPSPFLLSPISLFPSASYDYFIPPLKWDSSSLPSLASLGLWSVSCYLHFMANIHFK